MTPCSAPLKLPLPSSSSPLSYTWVLLLLSVCLTTTGCIGFRVHTDMGIANPWMGGERWIRPETHPLRVVQGTVHVETTVVETGLFAVDNGVGPMVLGGDQGWIVGAENLTRLRIKVHPRVHPYLVSKNGAGYVQGWRGSDVQYTFTTSIGVGVQFNLRPRLSVTVDLSWYHHSNGMSFHGDKTRQFFGLAEATRDEGYQNLMATVGAVWRF